MYRIRVFLNNYYKGIVSKAISGGFGTILFVLFLTPYLISLCFGNIERKEESALASLEQSRYCVKNETILGIEEIPLELYIADLLTRFMGEDYEMEALKALAILLRSGLVENSKQEISAQDTEYQTIPIGKKCLEAVTQTKAVYLMYEENPIPAACFAVSNGHTRSQIYPFIKSVRCERDFMAKDFVSEVVVPRRTFSREWNQLLQELEESQKQEVLLNELELVRDSAGYVTNIHYKGETVNGEAFRKIFGLNSTDFVLEDAGDFIKITVKGVGHGYGMSVFCANELAKEGKDYMEILNYFFQEIEFSKLE